MKKFLFLALSLFLGLGQAFADVDIKEGQLKSTSPIKFFVARYSRTGAIATVGGHRISKDSVVIWDSTSKDGVSVITSTTSYDGLVAGVTMDEIPGTSRDNTAAEDDAYGNWGRVQCWGKRDDVRWNSDLQIAAVAPVAGSRVAQSSTAQTAGLFKEQIVDAGGGNNTSRDSLGVSLEAGTATATTLDVFLDRC